MALDDVKEAAKAVIRRQVWESKRGKATRSFLRDHSEVAEEFEKTGTITTIGLMLCSACNGEGRGKPTLTEPDGAESGCSECEGQGEVLMMAYPEHVTRASVLLELNTRARRHESSVAARQWAKAHPEEADKMRLEIRAEKGPVDAAI